MTPNYHQNFNKGLFGKYAKVLQYIPANSDILEIGCHSGYFSKVLMEAGHSILGIEVDAHAAGFAEEAGISVLVRDIEQPSAFADIEQKFDLVLLMDVLEHLRDPTDILQRISPLLRDTGSIIVTGPNVAFWYMRLSLLVGHWQYTDGGIMDRTHMRFFNREGWINMIESGGYQVTHWEASDGLIPFESKMMRIGISPKFVYSMRRHGLRRAPSVFAISYLFIAKKHQQ